MASKKDKTGYYFEIPEDFYEEFKLAVEKTYGKHTGLLNKVYQELVLEIILETENLATKYSEKPSYLFSLSLSPDIKKQFEQAALKKISA